MYHKRFRSATPVRSGAREGDPAGGPGRQVLPSCLPVELPRRLSRPGVHALAVVHFRARNWLSAGRSRWCTLVPPDVTTSAATASGFGTYARTTGRPALEVARRDERPRFCRRVAARFPALSSSARGVVGSTTKTGFRRVVLLGSARQTFPLGSEPHNRRAGAVGVLPGAERPDQVLGGSALHPRLVGHHLFAPELQPPLLPEDELRRHAGEGCPHSRTMTPWPGTYCAFTALKGRQPRPSAGVGTPIPAATKATTTIIRRITGCILHQIRRFMSVRSSGPVRAGGPVP